MSQQKINRSFYIIYAFSLLLFSFFLPLAAIDKATQGAEGEQSAFGNRCAFCEQSIETKHSVVIDGKRIPYQATAGTLIIKDKEEKAIARFFYVAYCKQDSQPTERPIAFCFNGGPGAASVWLHLGMLGPKKIDFSEEARPLAPYHLIENEYSLLDAVDLIFIDPISTGYSRVVPGEDPKQFYGVEEDISSVAEFIRLYITRNGRWESPKFLIGESYGTTRAAGLAAYLTDEYHMPLQGLVLISAVLNFQAYDFDANNDLPYPLILPSYAATAWHHKKLSNELQGKPLRQLLQEVKAFAFGEYPLLLFKGDQLTPQEKEEAAKKLSYYTSLSPSLIMNNHLRIEESSFGRELLRKEGRLIGRFDSRLSGIEISSTVEFKEYDPSLVALIEAFTSTFNSYVRKELKWTSDEEYKSLATLWPWKWHYGNDGNHYLSLADTLRQAMTKHPSLRVFVANGFYDLATPFAAIEYTFDHLQLDPSIKRHIEMGYYEGGHMIYTSKQALIELKRDIYRFIAKTLAVP